MKLASLLAVTVALLLAGCGGDEESTMTDTLTVPPATSITDLSVYWLRDGKVWPARRWVDATEATAQAALGALLAGPTDEEASADPAFTTAIPEGTEIVDVIVKDGAATVELSAELPDEALAQVTYTVLSQFLTVDSLEIQGRNLTRGGFESLTPAILVESPLSFEEVSSPLRVTGTANTFEANFSYELTDTDGLIIAEDFVTATSGTGTRGTFEFTVPFEVKFDGVGALIVFEPSAKDGSRTNLVEIPIRMKR